MLSAGDYNPRGIGTDEQIKPKVDVLLRRKSPRNTSINAGSHSWAEGLGVVRRPATGPANAPSLAFSLRGNRIYPEADSCEVFDSEGWDSMAVMSASISRRISGCRRSATSRIRASLKTRFTCRLATASVSASVP